MPLGTVAVADPGFPPGRRQLPPGGGRQHTFLPNFPENCMKSKEFGRPGGGGGGASDNSKLFYRSLSLYRTWSLLM